MLDNFSHEKELHLNGYNTGMDFLGGGGGGGGGGGCVPPPEMMRTPPPPPKGISPFGTPTNYIYFDLIVSYLIILTTKFVKLPILSWSQILPCRPRKQYYGLRSRHAGLENKFCPWPFRALLPRALMCFSLFFYSA